MNEEELKLYVKKSCENILKQLAENPQKMLDLLELQDKYNNLLKEKIELKRQIKKKNEVINKAIEFLYKIKFDKTDKYICISEYIEYQQLLDILNEVLE